MVLLRVPIRIETATTDAPFRERDGSLRLRGRDKTSHRRNANTRSRVRCKPPAFEQACLALYIRISFNVSCRRRFRARRSPTFRFCPARRSASRVATAPGHWIPEIENAMSTEVLIGDGEAARLMPHPLRAAILGEVHARPFTPIAVPSRIVHFAFDTSGCERAGRPRQSDGVLRIARSAAAFVCRKTSPRPVRHDRPALGAAFGIHHLYLGNAGRPRGNSVPSGCGVAGVADAAGATARTIAGGGRPAPARGGSSAHGSGAPVRQCKPGRRRKFRWRSGLCHRLSARAFRLRPDPRRRPQRCRRNAPARWCSA